MIRGNDVFHPLDGHSMESLLSAAMVKCGAQRFEWRSLYNEPPSSFALVQAEKSPPDFIRCMRKRIHFTFYVRRVTSEYRLPVT